MIRQPGKLDETSLKNGQQFFTKTSLTLLKSRFKTPD